MRSTFSIVAALGLTVLVASCAQKPPPSGELPAPLPGAFINGRYTGSATVRGELAGLTVYGPERADLQIDLATAAGGVVTGVAQLEPAGPGLAPLLRDVRGRNDEGVVRFELPVRLCGDTVTVSLKGTMNPLDTINVGEVSLGSVCAGDLGTIRVERFTLTAVPR